MTDLQNEVYEELKLCFKNPCAVFGILGNIQAESGCRPNNLQNSFESKLDYTDESYTEALDSGNYTVEQFMNDKAGYGLCQWTFWSRKKALYEYWEREGFKEMKFSIGSVEPQIGFLYFEMSNVLYNKLESAKTIGEATRMFMLEYEKPANQSEENIQKRISIAQDLYLDFMKTSLDNQSLSNNANVKAALTDISETLERLKKDIDILVSIAGGKTND